MDNFFSKVNKTDINTTYHNPYKYLSTEKYVGKQSTRIGDFSTTLWMETAGLVISMSLVLLLPTIF